MATSAYHPFISAKAQADYLTYYDQRAKSWPIPSEARLVDTFLGQTFVRISGPSGAPPLVLLPGSVFNSLMWLPNIEALSRPYRTYAVDNIYDCGRSIYTRAPKGPDDFVRWLDELFTALELGNGIHLMGLSYGSWLTHLYALRYPARVGKIVMLGHPALVSTNAGFTFRFLLCFVGQRYFVNFINWLFQDTGQKDEASRRLVDDILVEMQLAGRSFKPKSVVIPKVLPDSQLRDLQAPALFLMGEHEKTFPPHKAIQRLHRVAPHLRTEIIPHAGHDMNFAQAELVSGLVLDFLKDPLAAFAVRLARV
jgi:pimeloyl-ACP methyl ester carboxylesterase